MDELKTRREVMRNSEKIAGQLYAALAVLEGEDEQPGAAQQIDQAAQAARSAAELLPPAQSAAQQLEDAAYGIQDAVESLRACTESLQFDPDQLEETEARLAVSYTHLFRQSVASGFRGI